jgi:hypothetical protein
LQPWFLAANEIFMTVPDASSLVAAALRMAPPHQRFACSDTLRFNAHKGLVEELEFAGRNRFPKIHFKLTARLHSGRGLTKHATSKKTARAFATRPSSRIRLHCVERLEGSFDSEVSN